MMQNLKEWQEEIEKETPVEVRLAFAKLIALTILIVGSCYILFCLK